MQQRFGGGETGDDVARRQRREALRRLDVHMDEGLRPIRDLIQQLKGVQPPDYGTLDVRTPLSVLQLLLESPSCMRQGCGCGCGFQEAVTWLVL